MAEIEGMFHFANIVNTHTYTFSSVYRRLHLTTPRGIVFAVFIKLPGEMRGTWKFEHNWLKLIQNYSENYLDIYLKFCLLGRILYCSHWHKLV